MRIDGSYITLDTHEEYEQLLNSGIARVCNWCSGVGGTTVQDTVVKAMVELTCSTCGGSGLLLNKIPPIVQDLQHLISSVGDPSKPILAKDGHTGQPIEISVRAGAMGTGKSILETSRLIEHLPQEQRERFVDHFSTLAGANDTDSEPSEDASVGAQDEAHAAHSPSVGPMPASTSQGYVGLFPIEDPPIPPTEVYPDEIVHPRPNNAIIVEESST